MEEENKLETKENYPKDNSSGKENLLGEIVKFVIIAIVFVIPFRILIAQPFMVNGPSMRPSFESSDYLIVDQLSYRFEEPKRSEVVIFKYPINPSKFFIKRVVGLPEETVKITNGQIYIINKENPSGFLIEEPYITYPKIDNLTITLNTDEYFVMGDNRASSSDSRSWGPLPRKNIVGKPLIRLIPLNKISFSPGDYSK